MTLENYIICKQKNVLFKKTVKKSKKESWKNFCLTLKSQTPIKNVWNIIKKLNNKPVSNNSQGNNYA